jgi:hypothetical protein
MTRRKKMAIIIPAAIAAMLLFAFLGGMIVRQLWNWLLPPLFGFPQLTFWQALGVLALSRILFGGFGFGGGSHRRHRREYWKHLTPEERERLRHGMCDARPAPDPAP